MGDTGMLAMHAGLSPQLILSQIEIDFVLQTGTEVIPVEVKKDKRTCSRSLNIFVTKYKSP